MEPKGLQIPPKCSQKPSKIESCQQSGKNVGKVRKNTRAQLSLWKAAHAIRPRLCSPNTVFQFQIHTEDIHRTTPTELQKTSQKRGKSTLHSWEKEGWKNVHKKTLQNLENCFLEKKTRCKRKHKRRRRSKHQLTVSSKPCTRSSQICEKISVVLSAS